MKQQGKVTPPDYTQAIENKISALKLCYYFVWGVGNLMFAIFMAFSNISLPVLSLSVFSVLVFSHFLISRYFKENTTLLKIEYKNRFEGNWIIDMIEIDVQAYREKLDKINAGNGKI